MIGTRGRCVLGMVGSDKHNKGIRTSRDLPGSWARGRLHRGAQHLQPTRQSVAVDEDADFVGVSFSNGNYLIARAEIGQALNDAGGEDIDVVLGGLIHAEDVPALQELGVAEVFGPTVTTPEIVTSIDRLLSRRRAFHQDPVEVEADSEAR